MNLLFAFSLKLLCKLGFNTFIPGIQYGEIVEDIMLRKTFGFVQFNNPDSVRAAIANENGRDVCGVPICKLNLDMLSC